VKLKGQFRLTRRQAIHLLVSPSRVDFLGSRAQNKFSDATTNHKVNFVKQFSVRIARMRFIEVIIPLNFKFAAIADFSSSTFQPLRTMSVTV
jgi:hypothetical protein